MIVGLFGSGLVSRMWIRDERRPGRADARLPASRDRYRTPRRAPTHPRSEPVPTRNFAVWPGAPLRSGRGHCGRRRGQVGAVRWRQKLCARHPPPAAFLPSTPATPICRNTWRSPATAPRSSSSGACWRGRHRSRSTSWAWATPRQHDNATSITGCHGSPCYGRASSLMTGSICGALRDRPS
jgi:hypothetical protein